MNTTVKDPQPTIMPVPNDDDVEATEDEQLQADQVEAMELANANLKKTIAEQLQDENIESMTADQLMKNPKNTAASLLKLYKDYKTLNARAKALAEERRTLLPKAARTEALERRLSKVRESSNENWRHIPAFDNKEEGLKCYALLMGAPNTVAPTLVMMTDGKGNTTLIRLERASVFNQGDGIYALGSS